MAAAFFFVLSGLPMAAYAAGLGKIVVFSALGQPLRAEIEVFATRDELSSMKVHLAPPETFKQVGVEYARTLLGIQFSLEKRSKGQSFIKLSTDRPINDPFVDLLLDLNWSSGRLVREFTFLLDPPEIGVKSAISVTPAKASAPATSGSSYSTLPRTSSAIDDDVRSKALASIRAQESTPGTVEPSAGSHETHKVRPGDTLQKVAKEIRRDGVSLERMLVGLFRTNHDAFDGGNMNRLKAGAVLSVPESSALEAISEGEARKIVTAQSSDWNAYRGKVATQAAQELGLANEEAGKQSIAGKITTTVVADSASAALPKDEVRISRLERANSKSGTRAKVGEEELIAKDKALRETNDRVASLEKNIANLQKLIELKNRKLAELQNQADPQTVPDTPISPRAADTAPASDEPGLAVAADSSRELPSPPVQPEVKSVQRRVNPPQPTPVEPSLIEEIIGNPVALGGAILLVVFGSYFLYKRRRQ